MKYFYYIVGLIMIILIINYVFNHISPWLGMILLLTSIGFSIYKLKKQIENE